MDKSIHGIKNKPSVYKGRLQPLCVAAITVFLLLMLEPAAVISSMQRSLRLCAGTVIPALFPYLVASELLVRSGAGERLAVWLSPPIRALFGVSDIGAMVYVMGILCGFPVAARTAASYVRVGKLSREEAAHLLCFCNVPSAAFIINAVGVSLYGDVIFGRLLWGLSLLSAAMIGVLYRWLCRPSKEAERVAKTQDRGQQSRAEDASLSAALVSAAGGMLSVVATVLFFGAVLGALSALMRHVSGGGRMADAQPLLLAMLSALFEMTGGVAAAAGLLESRGGGLLSYLLCAGAVGWGGLSVHFQLLAASEGICMPRCVGRFFLARLVQGVLCVVGVAIWLWLR